MKDSVISFVRLWEGEHSGSYRGGHGGGHRGLAVAGQPAAERTAHLWRISGVHTLGGHCRPLLLWVSIDE